MIDGCSREANVVVDGSRHYLVSFDVSEVPIAKRLQMRDRSSVLIHAKVNKLSIMSKMFSGFVMNLVGDVFQVKFS